MKPAPRKAKPIWTEASDLAQAGQRKRAHALFDLLWKQNPPAFEPWYNAGTLARQDGMFERALKFLAEAYRRAPNNPRVAFNYMLVLSDLKRFQEIVEVMEKVRFDTELRREALNLHAVALRNVGRREEGIAVLQRLLVEQPGFFPAITNLSNLSMDLERFDDALRYIQRDMMERPADLALRTRLADAAYRAHKFDLAVRAYCAAALINPNGREQLLSAGKRFYTDGMLEHAIQVWECCACIDPENAAPYANAGAALRSLKDYRKSEVAFRRSLVIEPLSTGALNGMGNNALDQSRYAEAVEWFEKAIEADADFLLARANLTRCFAEMQEWDKAAVQARAVVDLPELDQDQFVSVFSTLKKLCDFEVLGKHDFWSVLLESSKRGRFGSMLDSLSMVSDRESIQSLFDLHLAWAKRVGDSIKREPLPAYVRPARRRKLRVGLLSGDLRQHVVGMFMMPIFAHYDREKYEIIGLSTYPKRPDTLMNRIRDSIDGFVDLGNAKTRDAVQTIREQDIDVLVELNGFTKFGQLGAIEWRCAPVQVEYLGYPFTTGLSQMDYVLADRWIDPGGAAHLVEKVLRTEGSYYCLTDRERHGQGFGEDAIDHVCPAELNGFVTFGSFNNTYKITPAVVEAWARILHQVPNSRLTLVRYEQKNETLRRNLQDAFARHGIDPERIVIETNPRGWHMFWYNRVDVALDTFPQTGGTTTCETIWMGVPVVSLVGSEIFGRLSYSILMQAGLPELCCHDLDSYVATAAALGQDVPRITEYRRTLRDRIRSSPLCDEVGFTSRWLGAMEQAYDAL